MYSSVFLSSSKLSLYFSIFQIQVITRRTLVSSVACYFVNFLHFSLFFQILQFSFWILQFSFWILQFSLFLDFCFDYFQILPFSLFVGSTFLPIFITDYHAKLQPRFSYQCHSYCAIDVQTRFLASSHHTHPACSPIRISVFLNYIKISEGAAFSPFGPKFPLSVGANKTSTPRS